MVTRRFFIAIFLSCIATACSDRSSNAPSQMVVGVLSFGDGASSLAEHQTFKEHLSKSFKSVVQIEPALNEVQAVQQISQKSWDIVIAPPGLSAIAISQSQYSPVLPLEGANQERSIIVVKKDSDLSDLKALANQTIALGHEGSATGYYFPIYNLYGITLAGVRFAPTPKTILEWVDSGEVVAGALSVAEFETYQSEFSAGFKILFRDEHPVPAGSILVSPDLDEDFRAELVQVLEQSPPSVLESVGFVPNAAPPSYDYLIQVVKRVRPIAQRIKEQPAPLYERSTSSQSQS
jgi:phosphonate transport system substrate-binding protein